MPNHFKTLSMYLFVKKVFIFELLQSHSKQRNDYVAALTRYVLKLRTKILNSEGQYMNI